MAYYKKNYGSLNKDSKIEKAMARKEKSIKTFTDKKSISIMVSSAFNTAAQICVALISTGKMEDKDFWEVHSIWFKEYFEKFAQAQMDGEEMYNSVMHTYLHDKESDGGLDDFANDI